jgi:membrane associated rhomboid family serine protease
MFLPLGDEPNPHGIPYVNYGLILANVAVYVLVSLPLSFTPADPQDPMVEAYVRAISENLPPGVSLSDVVQQVSAYDLVVFSWGYRTSEPSPLKLFTAMFLHGGFMHLFGNMLFLWIYGDNVEHRLGRVKYLFWYLATGVAATLFYALFAGRSSIPLVGASGAISGVLGFYFLWFPHNRVRLWVFLFPMFARTIVWPARVVLGIYLVLDNILPFLVSQGQGGGGVAHGAHIGGFLAGLVVAWVAGQRAVTSRPAEYRGRTVPASDARSSVERLAAAMKAQDFETAARLYFELPSQATRNLLSPDDSIGLGNWLARNGHAEAALVLYQRHLRDHPTGRGAAEAHAYAGLLQLHAFREPTAAYQHLVDALDLNPSQDIEALVRDGLAEIARMQKFQVRGRELRH